ncbi:hypothetical protein BDF19DRAFT_23505 [Syncephalis fuscata]|nr:hypothetical protein BDF19DRAFT_23505 [Syncephalis fuscata]
MSDPIGGAVQAAELLGRAAYFIWQETRTTLQVNISNRHPRLKLQNFARYCHAGQCSEPQAFSILPEQSRTFRFIAHALGTHIDGCCVYSITAFNRPPATTHNIYLLLAWNIQLGGACKVMLNLVETYPGQDISTSLLKEHYLKDVVPQFQPSGTMMIRTWNLGDDDTKFTVNVSLTDVANGIMEVEIIPANKDAIMNRPFFLTTNYFENVTWDTAGNESEKTKTDDDKFGLTSSMNVFIHNDCENLTLTNCSSIVRNGKLKTRGHNFIGYRAQSKYIFKNKTPFGRTSGTVVYELQHSEQNAPPLLWGYRIFLAMDFLVTAHDHTLRKVCSTLLAVKNANFPEYTDALLHAHEKILGHHMFMRGRPSQWHLHNFDLKISVRFKRLSHAEFYIRLEKAFTKNFNGVPLFLPTGENSDISQDARNTINRYIKSNKQGHGILALEIERDLKIEVEPLMPEHANENAISIECNCSGGVLSSSGKCIFHEKVSESSWSFMHLFAITPTLSVAKSPYLCLLRVKRTYDSFITAVVFTFRGNSSNEELEKTLDYFFAYSGIVGKQENTTENSYDHGRLMERRINLRPDVNFQLITYLSSEPNRLFKIMLKKEFDPAVNNQSTALTHCINCN